MSMVVKILGLHIGLYWPSELEKDEMIMIISGDDFVSPLVEVDLVRDLPALPQCEDLKPRR